MALIAVAAMLLTSAPALAPGDALTTVRPSEASTSPTPGHGRGGFAPSIATDSGVARTLAFNATSEIGNMTFAISEGSVLRHLEKLVAFDTRYTYSRQSLEASEYIYETLESCGLQVEYHDYLFGTIEHRNVIATLEGENASAPAYYLGAHYDSISNQPYVKAPGADDDGTGTAAILAAAEVLSNYRFNRTIVFCAFSGEEQGLYGSKAYAKALNASGESVAGAICLDMVGYNPAPGDRDLLVRANSASMDLAYAVHNVSVKYPALVINGSAKLDPATNSDHAAFWAYAWDAVNFIEEKYPTNPNYHQTTDTIGYLNMTYAANSTQLAVACVAEMAELRGLDEAPPIYQNAAPVPGGHSNETPVVGIEILDVSGVVPASIVLQVNGSEVSHSSTAIAGGYGISFVPIGFLVDGTILSCRIEANDTLGNNGIFWWNATVDAVAPPAPVISSVALERVRPAKSGLVMNIGASGSYDDFHVINPAVIHDGSVLKMWYGAYDGSTYRIAYATSADGYNWTKHGVVLDVGAVGEPDSRHVADCTVVKVGAEYKMWYSGHNGTSYRILHADSTDGVNWTRRGMAMDHGAPGSPDDQQALNPDVLFTGAEYRMYYAGSDGLTYRVLLAISIDGSNWTRRGVVLEAGRSGIDECISIQGPAVVQAGTGYMCWYMGNDGYRTRVFTARSPDGFNWTKLGLSIDVGASSDYDYVVAAHPCAIVDNGTVRIWYNGQNGYYRILHASMALASPGYLKESVAIEWSPVGGEVGGYEVFATTSWAECLAPPETGWARAQGDGIFIHNGAGTGNGTTYYYTLRAVDRVGHSSMHWTRAIKAATPASAGWNPLGPVDAGGTGLEEAFEALPWDGLMAWNATDAANHWRTNFTARAWQLNDLDELWPMAGCWVRVSTPTVHVAVGLVSNVTLQLQAGWNFVSFPHAAQKTYAQVLAELGAACTAIEGFDAAATYRLKTLGASDTLKPGMAYWILMSAAAPWAAGDY